MTALVMVGLIILVLGLYWLPSIVARIQRHPDLVPIVLVNALLGWTVVGWVWAAMKNARGHAGHRLQLEGAYGANAAGEQAPIRER